MSTLATVEQVMRQTQTPMSVRDIVETAGDALPTRSKTPDTVVARDLSMDIKRLGDESRFIRTAPGRYTLREFVSCGLIQMGDTGGLPTSALADAVASQSAIAPTRVAQSAAAPSSKILAPFLKLISRALDASASRWGIGNPPNKGTVLRMLVAVFLSMDRLSLLPFSLPGCYSPRIVRMFLLRVIRITPSP